MAFKKYDLFNTGDSCWEYFEDYIFLYNILCNFPIIHIVIISCWEYFEDYILLYNILCNIPIIHIVII